MWPSWVIKYPQTFQDVIVAPDPSWVGLMWFEALYDTNIVNMGLPANIIAGTGFGMISKTAGTSRQVQFSLKLIY